MRDILTNCSIWKLLQYKKALHGCAALLDFKNLSQLGEVLDGADHLRNVGVLVVVPGNHLNLGHAAGQLVDHGLGSIEQRTVTDADDVGGHDLILVVAIGIGSSSLHRGVDTLFGDVLALNNGNQQSGGAGAGGHALGSADQLAVQLGDNQADGLSGTGGVGNDVLSAGAGTTQIALAMGAVQNHLVAGVGVHGGHNTALDGSVVVQSLSHGR